jgi:hypothetical protein
MIPLHTTNTTNHTTKITIIFIEKAGDGDLLPKTTITSLLNGTCGGRESFGKCGRESFENHDSVHSMDINTRVTKIISIYHQPGSSLTHLLPLLPKKQKHCNRHRQASLPFAATQTPKTISSNPASSSRLVPKR